MISLVIDTCTSNLVIAVCKYDKVLSQLIQKNDTNLSTNFTSLVDGVIKDANITIDDIEQILVANGPGSFTGIRVGLTFAKVFAWAKKVKIVPFSSLELLASSCDTDYIVSLLDARRGCVYAGIYDHNLNCIVNDQYIELNELLETSKNYSNISFVSCDNFDLDIKEPNYNVIKIVERHSDDDGVNPHTLNPNYLKKTEAEEKLGIKND